MTDEEKLEKKHDIVLSISNLENNVTKGWVNKPKGMLQMLWERGFIDEAQVNSPRSSRYPKDGRKGDVDVDRKLSEEGERYSLSALLMKYTDFRTKVTDLEHLGKGISTIDHSSSILFTPKFHYELAIEGIKYSWGASKRCYRKQSLSKKKSYKALRVWFGGA